eukprot:gene5871-9068_t
MARRLDFSPPAFEKNAQQLSTQQFSLSESPIVLSNDEQQCLHRANNKVHNLRSRSTLGINEILHQGFLIDDSAAIEIQDILHRAHEKHSALLTQVLETLSGKQHATASSMLNDRQISALQALAISQPLPTGIHSDEGLR